MASSRELALLVFLAGCGAGTGGEPVAGASACPPDSYLDYRNFGAPFLRSWCTGCHSAELTGEDRAGAPLGVNFDTRAGTLLHLERIEVRAAAQVPTMPPRGVPGPDERALLKEWIACGAP